VSCGQGPVVYRIVHTEEWSESRPPHLGAPPGTDYYTAVFRRFELGGCTYESKMTWIGHKPGARNTVVYHASDPADQSALDIRE
jgi:hypothetical protein